MSSDAGDGRQLSAGIIVVRAADDGFRYLLLRAYRHWDFPKGRVEPGETPLAAAWRETEEETGLARLAFRWGESYFETEPYGTRARGGDRSREGTGPSVGGRGGKSVQAT
jgi:8-oxo-dGTP pyrophosphatase MutT (NUDIX family)